MPDIPYILKASSVENTDLSAYFNPEKKLYSAIPVYPFLSDEEIEAAIEQIVDANALNEELEKIKAIPNTAIIPGTEFIICLTDWNTYPQLIRLLTIIREWAFRNEGGGVGHNDFDNFDPLDITQQLIILNPSYESPLDLIIGGYRYVIHQQDTYKEGPMGEHFSFSDAFKSQDWIELGRSFINPHYQKKATRQSFDYVLHGLGYIYACNPHITGYFGKVTLYHIYEIQKADEFFLAIGEKYFRQSKEVWVHKGESINAGTLTEDQKKTLDRDIFKGLFYILRNDFQINLVPIMAIYNRLAALDNIFYYGAFRHTSFGNSTEVGIGIEIDVIRDVIMEKFVEPYKNHS